MVGWLRGYLVKADYERGLDSHTFLRWDHTMQPDLADRPPPTVTVRYWASARAAAGHAEERVSASTLAELIDRITSHHGNANRFADIIDCCAILLGDTPVGTRDRAKVLLNEGDTLEFLPPFAGG